MHPAYKATEQPHAWALSLCSSHALDHVPSGILIPASGCTLCGRPWTPAALQPTASLIDPSRSSLPPTLGRQLRVTRPLPLHSACRPKDGLSLQPLGVPLHPCPNPQPQPDTVDSPENCHLLKCIALIIITNSNSQVGPGQQCPIAPGTFRLAPSSAQSFGAQPCVGHSRGTRRLAKASLFTHGTWMGQALLCSRPDGQSRAPLQDTLCLSLPGRPRTSGWFRP